MVVYVRRNMAMLTSVGAMVVTILLIIFFGAWAVAASSQSGVGNALNDAIAGFSGAAPQPGRSVASDPDAIPRLASASAAADTWWGKAFLVACPLH